MAHTNIAFTKQHEQKVKERKRGTEKRKPEQIVMDAKQMLGRQHNGDCGHMGNGYHEVKRVKLGSKGGWVAGP